MYMYTYFMLVGKTKLKLRWFKDYCCTSTSLSYFWNTKPCGLLEYFIKQKLLIFEDVEKYVESLKYQSLLFFIGFRNKLNQKHQLVFESKKNFDPKDAIGWKLYSIGFNFQTTFSKPRLSSSTLFTNSEFPWFRPLWIIYEQ